LERDQLSLQEWGQVAVLEGLELMAQAGAAPAPAEDVMGTGREGRDELEAAASAAALPDWWNTFDVFVVGSSIACSQLLDLRCQGC